MHAWTAYIYAHTRTRLPRPHSLRSSRAVGGSEMAEALVQDVVKLLVSGRICAGAPYGPSHVLAARGVAGALLVGPCT